MNSTTQATAAAASKRRRVQREEEEYLTPYEAADLSGEQWEFKIVRANTDYFKNKNKLSNVLAEETLAGWTLIEKFDDSRIRLKRPISAREKDSSLKTDPYRSEVGISEMQLIGLVTIGLVGLLASLIIITGVCSGVLVFQFK
ncbi:MAG: hypothetical protein IAF58_05425 [Leptolyngbya sp.]|nr:hypothetical protein [Candidatus Melainabacteria bacterium]